MTIGSICLLRLSAIGDVTHVLPVVHALQKQLPGVRLTWIIGKLEAKLVGDLPGVEFIIFDKKAGRAGYLALYRTLKGRRFDVLLQMQVALRANLVSALIRADRRIGYDRSRSKDLHSLFINERIRPTSQQHVRDCLASFLEPLGLPAAEPRWQIPLSEQDHAFARQHLATDRPNVVISPCSSHALRNWLPERYAALADHAIRVHGARVILVGSPSAFEKEFVAAIEEKMQERAINLVGQDTLKQLAALLGGADLVVAPDTGPAHIANAMGTDVLGLYAGSNPNRSGPYHSLKWCVNRYPDAIRLFRHKTVEEVSWGAKAEFSGAMELISTEDATVKMDIWFKGNLG
ncbi:MAG: glycosyltransferase family 9 protein [Alcanivoracaceae bacterium]